MRTSIAIPDSCLNDESTNLDKSRKIAIIARACAIFGIDVIYIYEDGGTEDDESLLLTILRYMDTPQFLRRRLFPKMNELKYAGVLHPLKIPSHRIEEGSDVKKGSIRDGIIIKSRGRLYADFGLDMPLPYKGRLGPGKRITARFATGQPEYRYNEVAKHDISSYWGYAVKKRGPLSRMLESWNDAIIFTSRKGRPITPEHIRNYQSMTTPLLLVYGSTDRGIHEILGRNLNKIAGARTLNFFPGQATETVRLEEAVMGTLAILNLP